MTYMKIQKHIKWVLLLLFVYAQVGLAQTARWSLVSDGSATVTGNITATAQTVTGITITSYTAYNGPLGVPSQRARVTSGWPQNAVYNPSLYYEYTVTPTAGNSFTIGSVSLPMGAVSTGNMRATIYYSTNNFATSTLLASAVVLANGSYNNPTPIFSPNVTINAGTTFSLRVYPHYTASDNSTSRYVVMQNVQISGSTSAAQQQVAFPGAEGHGKFVSGGRGTATVPSTVFAVTSLADDGAEGTLRWALNEPATHRTIVFKVSGTIHLNSDLKISKPNTTVAGQTAPGDGICIADHTVSVSAENVIVRYMRFRLGDRYQNLGMVDGSGSDDTFNSLQKNNIIIDHCTISWSTDEALSFYRADNLTLQWNLISEPLNYSYHFETGDTDWERHGFGGIWGGMHASFHHNLLAHCHGRSPRFDGGRNLGDGATIGLENADFRNNVIYNWGNYNLNGGEGGNYNIVNNYYKYGPSTNPNVAAGVNTRAQIINPWKESPLPYGKYYLSGNYVDGYAQVTNNNWSGASFYQGSPSDSINSKVSIPFPLMDVPTQTPAETYEAVLKGAGAILPKRDTLDQRIIQNVINRTGRVIDVQGGFPHGTPYAATVNAWPTLNSMPPLPDSDADGMPDSWETSRGLNPTNANDRNGYNANGYSNLENYLNGDSTIAKGTNNTCIAIKNIIVTSGGGWADAKDTSYANVIPTDTMNVVASIKNDGNYPAFAISYFITQTTRMAGGKPYLNRNVTINPASAVAVPVTVRLYFTAQELAALQLADNSITLNSLKVYRTNDVTCVSAINVTNFSTIDPTATGLWGTYQTGYYIEFTTISFGTFFIGGPSFSLPANLLSFNAYLEQKQVNVSWSTASEVNVGKYGVEKSADGRNFTTIGIVAAKGDYSLQSNYNFMDVSPFDGTNYYRLKIMDKDGRYKYGPIAIVGFHVSGNLFVYPNPARGNLMLAHPKATTGSIIDVLTTDGKKVKRFPILAGTQQTYLDVANINAGKYILRFQNGEEKAMVTVMIL